MPDITSQTIDRPASVTWTAPVDAALLKVRERLVQLVPPDSMLLEETMRMVLSSGGKYMRPAMTLLVGAATGKITDALIETAAVAEMIHIATLLHDDVLDNSELRRGKKTVRALWGNTVSVLSGDYLLAQASLKLATIGHIRLVAIYSHVLSDLCDGEVEQIRTSYSLDKPDWDSYYRKSVCKTASLFSAGCESAGVLSQLQNEHIHEERIQSLRSFGRNLGIAFQIVDDLLDYTSSEADMGKPVLDDLRNGLLNAPVLLALESDALSETDLKDLKEAIGCIFDAEVENTPQEAIDTVRRYLTQTQAIEKTMDLAQSFVDKALADIEFISASPEKDALIGLGRQIVHRRN